MMYKKCIDKYGGVFPEGVFLRGIFRGGIHTEEFDEGEFYGRGFSARKLS